MALPASSGTGRAWERARRVLSDLTRAQRALWENLERIAPDPDPYLHWEPTSAGWRLYGRSVPPMCTPSGGPDDPM